MKRGLPISRRKFLLYGGLGTLATCGGLGTWRACWYPDASAYRGLRTLSPRQGVILAAVVDTVLPPEAARDAETLRGHVAAIDAYLVGLDAGDRRQLGQLIYALEHATLPFGGKWSRFSSLERGARAAVLDGWRTAGMTKRRLGYRSLVSMIFLVYYRDAAAFAPIGYGGPVLPGGNPSAELRARYDALRAPAGARPRGGGARGR